MKPLRTKPSKLIDPWAYDISTWYPSECSPYIGNGFIGGNLGLDGHGAANVFAAAVSGFFVGNEESLTVPHWMCVPIDLDGKPCAPMFVKYRQVLDLARGSLETSYTDSTRSVRVTTRTFCHRGRREIAAWRVSVTALTDVTVTLSPQLSLKPCGRKPASLQRAAHTLPESAWTLDFNDASSRLGQALAVEASPAVEARPLDSAQALGHEMSHRLTAGNTLTLTGIVATCYGAAPVEDARRLLAEARDLGFDKLEASQAVAMKQQVWDDFQFECDNPYFERRVRSAMFYVSAGYRSDIAVGGSPSGLASKIGWSGCTFWDTEFYMYPPLLMVHPELARSIVQYRFDTLEGARWNAQKFKEQGARYAWESKQSGRSFSGMFDEQRHIGTEVAFCAWWYGQSTGDSAFMAEKGNLIIAEVARNVASRTVFSKNGTCGMLGVIPGDEHVMDHHVGATVDHSAMTNAYAAWVLGVAAALGSDAGVTADEGKSWRRMAKSMHIPRSKELGIILEYEGYNGHPIKQADVGHMFFPLRFKATRDEIRRNTWYYADRERETALYIFHSPSAYGCSLSRAGDGKGVEHFLRLSDLNCIGPFENPRESNFNTGGPVVSAAGSFLTLVLHGMLGIENMDAKLSAHPHVPWWVGKASISGISFRGARYSVAAAPGKTTARIRRLGQARALATERPTKPAKTKPGKARKPTKAGKTGKTSS